MERAKENMRPEAVKVVMSRATHHGDENRVPVVYDIDRTFVVEMTSDKCELWDEMPDGELLNNIITPPELRGRNVRRRLY